MKNHIAIYLLLLLLNWNCLAQKKSLIISKNDFFQSVTIDTLLKDNISIRAIIVTSAKVWYAADKGRVGCITYADKNKLENIVESSNNPLEFRSIAQTSKATFVLNVGNPAQLFQFSNDLKTKKRVYEEENEKVFYDSMQFWNDDEGIAIGDPIENCLSIIITHDGGNSWQKIPCTNLPKVFDGEAAFAASNTNVIIKRESIWIVTGGKKARVFYSRDKAKTWQVFETPIDQGLEMTGIFTADFYNETIGCIAGGNYEKQNQNFSNKALTIDSGKTWKLIAENQAFGYASCIQFVPESDGTAMACIASAGLYYSHDSGATWKLLLENKDLYTLRFINKNSAVVAGSKGILKINFK